jgi:hypothetical protein
LLETLARLRENNENHKGDGQGADSALPGDEDAGVSVSDGEPDSSRDTTAPRGDRAHRRARPRTTARRRNPGSRPGDKPPQRDSRLAGDEAPDEDMASRPMIDFVLSEIERPLPLPVSGPPQPKPATQTRPDEAALPSFVEQAQRRAFWGLPRVRAVLAITAGVLAVTLAAQITASRRDWLAAHYPGATPLLRALCYPMHCRIAPWRRLDAVMVDSIAFSKVNPHGFNFALTLRNTGAAPVATPALELTLRDAQDQPLARRVLQPADWGAPPQLAGYAEFNGVALLTVLDAANPQAFHNGHVEPFYP